MRNSDREILVDALSDKEYREEFVDQRISVGIASQIREMRSMRGWTQIKLAEESGTRQQVISQIENPDYGKLTISTLKRLAAAFDVALVVKFSSFSELVDDYLGQTPENLAIPEFGKDQKLQEDSRLAETTVIKHFTSVISPQTIEPSVLRAFFLPHSPDSEENYYVELAKGKVPSYTGLVGQGATNTGRGAEVNKSDRTHTSSSHLR